MFKSGLVLCTENNKYRALIDGQVYDLVVGEIISNLCNSSGLDVIKILKKCPLNRMPCTKKNITDALLWLNKEFTAFFDVTTALLFALEISNSAADYFNYKTKTLNYLKKRATKDKNLYDEIFKDTQYLCPGDIDVGNLLLSLLGITALAFSNVVTILDKLVGDSDPEIVLSIFTTFLEGQHFDYKISLLDGKFTPIYTICNMFSLAVFEVSNIVNNQTDIKRCKNCNNFFVPINRSDTLYCDGMSPQDNTKTCKEYGSAQAYKEKLRNDTASGLYRAIYMQKTMLVKRNPDILKYKDDFEIYKSQVKQWKQDIKNGIRNEEEYINWLENIKSKKE